MAFAGAVTLEIVGTTASTFMPVVVSGVNESVAALATVSAMEPPLSVMAEATSMPSISSSLATIVYRNVSVVLPLPER